jgi:hypothetical protein
VRQRWSTKTYYGKYDIREADHIGCGAVPGYRGADERHNERSDFISVSLSEKEPYGHAVHGKMKDVGMKEVMSQCHMDPILMKE